MNNNTFIHKYIKPLISKEDIVIDMTAGNGNDTLFLANLAKQVYGFDISDKAIENTKEKVKDFNNVILIKDNHINVDKYVSSKVKLAIFNLGYLPGDNEEITTKADETLIAFKKAYELLMNDGYLVITFYLRQNGGLDEYYLLDDYIKKNRLQIIETYRQDKVLSPITYLIRKLI